MKNPSHRVGGSIFDSKMVLAIPSNHSSSPGRQLSLSLLRRRRRPAAATEAAVEAAAEEEDEEAVETLAEAAVEEMTAAEIAVALLNPSPLLSSNLLFSQSFPCTFAQNIQGPLSHSFAATLPASFLTVEGTPYVAVTSCASIRVPGLIYHILQNRLSMSQSTKRQRQSDAEDSLDVVETDSSRECPVPALFIDRPSDDVRHAIQNFLKCGICNSNLSSCRNPPRILHCGHSLCTRCVKKLHECGSRSTIVCPYCRIPTVASDIKKVVTNYFVTNVLESVSKSDLTVSAHNSKHDASKKASIVSIGSHRSQTVSGINTNGVTWEYFGQLNAQKARDGYGKCSWSDGTTYAGEWKDGAMHGNGVLHFCTGDFYVGSLQKNASHGVGVLVQTNGTVSSGIWKDGKFIA